MNENDEYSDLLYGTKELKELVKPWLDNNRLFVIDLYFSYCPDVTEIHRNNVRFISVLKTATSF